MKKLLLVILSCALILIYSSIALADETNQQESSQTGAVTEEVVEESATDVAEDDIADSPEVTVEETSEETATNNDESESLQILNSDAGLTPDSFLYPIDRLIESVQVALTINAEGKAELLIQFANERLAEAEIMSEKNKLDLAEKVIRVYAKTIKKANDKISIAIQQDKDVIGIIERIEIVQGTAENIIIKTTGVIPDSIAEELIEAITIETKKVIAVKAFITAKDNFAEAKKLYKDAKEEYKNAKESGDEAAIQAALEKKLLAEQYKDKMEQAKDAVESYKEQVKEKLELAEKELEKQRKLSEQELKKQEKELEQQHKKAEKEREKLEKKLEKQLKKEEKDKEKQQRKLDKKRDHEDNDEDNNDEDEENEDD